MVKLNKIFILKELDAGGGGAPPNVRPPVITTPPADTIIYPSSPAGAAAPTQVDGEGGESERREGAAAALLRDNIKRRLDIIINLGPEDRASRFADPLRDFIGAITNEIVDKSSKHFKANPKDISIFVTPKIIGKIEVALKILTHALRDYDEEEKDFLAHAHTAVDSHHTLEDTPDPTHLY